MCVGMLSMFALIFPCLVGWGIYKLGKTVWENKSTIARTALAIYNLPETAYQTFTTRQKISELKKPPQKLFVGADQTHIAWRKRVRDFGTRRVFYK